MTNPNATTTCSPEDLYTRGDLEVLVDEYNLDALPESASIDKCRRAVRRGMQARIEELEERLSQMNGDMPMTLRRR